MKEIFGAGSETLAGHSIDGLVDVQSNFFSLNTASVCTHPLLTRPATANGRETKSIMALALAMFLGHPISFPNPAGGEPYKLVRTFLIRPAGAGQTLTSLLRFVGENGGVAYVIMAYEFVFPIAAYLPETAGGDSALIHFQYEPEYHLREAARDAAAHLVALEAIAKADSCEARQIIGLGLVGNFGHSIWNELSGALRYHKLAKIRDFSETVVGPYFGFEKPDELLPEFPEMNCFDSIADLIDYVNHGNFIICRPFDFLVDPETVLQPIYNHFKLGEFRNFYDRAAVARKTVSPSIIVHLSNDNWGQWVSEIEDITCVLNSLARKFPGLEVVFDGYTKLQGKFQDTDYAKLAQIDAKAEAITKGLNNIQVSTIRGAPLGEKIARHLSARTYLCRFGSPLTIPCWIVDMPGVAVGPSSILNKKWDDLYMAGFFEFMTQSATVIPVEKVSETGMEYRPDRGWIEENLASILSKETTPA